MADSTKNQHVPVFISSTYNDLHSHRAEVERILVGLEQIVKGMEYFGSSPETPLDVCLEQISECKLFILILGVSYGSLEPGTKKSFTELEYEYALERNIPVLAYLADTTSTKIGIPLDSFDIENAPALNELKKKVSKKHTVSFFTSIDDLGKKVAHDVPKALKKLNDVSIKVSDVSLDESVTEEMLREGSEKFQRFWLRPISFEGEIVPLRLRINTKWNGWKVKDELIRSLGLGVGDTISTEITPILAEEIIDHGDDTDLFASGEAADWLLENAKGPGSVIDCFVQFAYAKAPIGENSKMIHKLSLIMVSGIQFVYFDSTHESSSSMQKELAQLFAKNNGLDNS